MKRSIMARILAVLLVVSMVCPTAVSAAGFGLGSGSTQSIGDWVRSTIGQIISGWTRPGQGSGSGNDSGSGSQSWDLIEDSTTVLNGDMLRASTYGLSDSGTSVQADSGTTLKYFPVTLYDYDTTTINNATHLKEVTTNADLTLWEGLYFSAGSPKDEAFEYTTSASAHTDLTWAQVQNGTYYSDEACTTKATVSAITETGYEKASVKCNNLISQDKTYSWSTTGYYYTPDNGANYYPLYAKRSSSGSWGGGTKTYTYTWGYSTTASSSGVTTISTQTTTNTSDSPNIDVYTKTSVTTGYTLTANGKTLATLNSTDTTQKVGVTLYSKGSTKSTLSLVYAEWNWWRKGKNVEAGSDDEKNNGQKFYTGLVESELDANKNPVFTVPEGGIFNSDSSVKSIYTNVEMPFVYDSATQSYTFDASKNGVYFYTDTTQGSSGTAASNTRLYFNANATQSNGKSYGDGSSTVWAPFNSGTSLSESTMNYHFGMRATIPFTMTSNGRMNENNDESKAIKFSFSGDDDVWVFIDGHLVIDLGGIHNRLDAVIDFANNTVTYSANNGATDNGKVRSTGSFNDEDFALEQTLFGGLISQDRETFAASETHELTIFYLERGKGASNCKISFNLPMKDTVTVTKRASQSWNHNNEELDNLTTTEQEAVDNISFGFTLYKSTDGENFAPVANTKYKILDADGQAIDTRTTDSKGHFYLKNNNSARFITEFSSAGVSYYVVEDNMSSGGFTSPDFSYGGTSADGFSVGETKYTSGTDIPATELEFNAAVNESSHVTVYGSDESEDSLVFICKNFLDATMPNPSAFPSDDKIVLDYGLSVNINLLGNDVYRGDSIEVLGVYGGDVTLTDAAKETVLDTALSLDQIVESSTEPVYGEAALNGNTISYQLNKQLTGVEVLTYLVQVTGSVENSNGEDVVAYAYGLAHVYIIPATTMYYEENFGFVEFKDGTSGGWTVVGTPDGQAQEPGVVGTTTDSPYGSDVAYLNDHGDSNGTSMYVNTTTGAAQFSYTFTGTGTTFYARTSNNSGYMRVKISGDAIKDTTILRDTYFDDTNSEVKGTLYNIPVYSSGTLPYGTYTVTVTIAKLTQTSALTYHSEFWLDGIRVFNPLDPADENYNIATSAYAADGETGMTSVTLRNQLLSNAVYVEQEHEYFKHRQDENGNYIYKENGDPVYDRVVETILVPQWPEDGTFVMFTDTNGEIVSAAEYQSIGPKEEVYLYSGQTVTFTVADWDPNTNRLFLGMKSPTGKSGQVTIGSQVINVSNTADCYYEISNYGKIEQAEDGTKTVTYVITAGEGVLISLTDMKITGTPEFEIPDDDFIGDDENFEEENADLIVEENDETATDEDVTVDADDNDEPASESVNETDPETQPEAKEPEEPETAEEPEATEENVEGDE